MVTDKALIFKNIMGIWDFCNWIILEFRLVEIWTLLGDFENWSGWWGGEAPVAATGWLCGGAYPLRVSRQCLPYRAGSARMVVD